MRFSLRNLFLIIALLALFCAGMTYRNHWWLMGITTLTLTAVVAAALMAIVRRARQRAILCGFCIVGLLYYYFASHTETGARLPTTAALAAVGRALNVNADIGPPRADPFGIDVDSNGKPTFSAYLQQISWYRSNPVECFAQIGHCLWSLLFATLAAWLVARMYDRHNPPTKAPS